MPPSEDLISDSIGPSGDEHVSLDVDPPGAYLDPITKAHADTRNKIALIFTVSMVASLPLYLLAKYFLKGTDDLDKVFDKWFSVVGPLAGAAIGAYSVSVSKN